jgi:hypothetical protein
MDNIADGSIDMVLCDLPYGTTRNKWDSVIDLPSLYITHKKRQGIHEKYQPPHIKEDAKKRPIGANMV